MPSANAMKLARELAPREFPHIEAWAAKIDAAVKELYDIAYCRDAQTREEEQENYAILQAWLPKAAR